MKTSPEYTRAGVYGKCVLQQIQIIFNGLNELETYHTFNVLNPNKDSLRMKACMLYVQVQLFLHNISGKEYKIIIIV